MFNKLKLLCILLIFLFSSCAKPTVVEIVQPNDKTLNCDQLEEQVDETQKVKSEAQYARENTGGNVARVILFWPAWATTLHNADKAISAANDRTFHLLKLMKKNNCKRTELIKTNIEKRNMESVVYQLKILREMYDNGELTKEEYRKAKKKVIEE